MTRLIILGTTDFTIVCTKALLDAGINVAALISLPLEMRPLNSTDIQRFAKEKKIPYHEVEDINSWGAIEIMKRYEPEYIFSTWPKIIGTEVIKIPKVVIGTHPTTLPFNRGRHPLHWLIVLDIPKSHLSFFRIDEKVDNGEIFLQVPFSIDRNDTIADAIRRMNEAASRGIKKIANMIKTEQLVGKAQDNTKANYWRKRTPHDVTIDPRMSADAIIRMVRSFTRPYPCANLIVKDTILKVIYARTAKTGETNIEQGKIIKVDGQVITFKADDMIVEAACEHIPEHIAKEKYIYPPSYYITHFPELREKMKDG